MGLIYERFACAETAANLITYANGCESNQDYVCPTRKIAVQLEIQTDDFRLRNEISQNWVELRWLILHL